MKGVEKFLTNKQLEDKNRELDLETKKHESTILYSFDRTESSEGFYNVETLHGVSFIKDIIPELIRKKKKGEKVKILDVGSGAGSYSEEIRKIFQDKVKVFSTGLSKETAKKYRESKGNNSKLHPNDLKWRSILELSDFEEFDLIIDSIGEFDYSLSAYKDKPQECLNRFEQYIRVISKKLKHGGLASIASVFFIENKDYRNLVKRLEKEHNIKIDIIERHPIFSMKISKQ